MSIAIAAKTFLIWPFAMPFSLKHYLCSLLQLTMAKALSLQELEEVAFHRKEVKVDGAVLKNMMDSFDFLVGFSKDKIIYGINTGFGPMAQFKIEKEDLHQLQYNLIRSHCSGAGSVLNEVYARSVVMARLNNFLQGHSGVSPEVALLLADFLNKKVVPEIFELGGVGASGDLVQLAHLGLNLIGEGYVYVNGNRQSAPEVFTQMEMKPLTLQLRDGLGIINGTSCMTGIGAVNLVYARRLLDWSLMSSAIINEVVESFDDSFSKELNGVKLHEGQKFVAEELRTFLKDSKMIRSRKELFSDEGELSRSEFKNKIQEYYSIRCVPQILGPVYDTLAFAIKVVENELNSTNDNPVVIPSADNVFHGGNFHGDYVSFEMDKIKMATAKVSVLAERQLNFLLNHKLNGKFPPFLNGKKPGFNFGLQGMQFMATSTTAENQVLSNSVYVHSIPNNNDNQDVVSMGTNSAMMAKRVIDNSFRIMSVLVMAVCQCVDLLPEEERQRLCPQTQKFYSHIRNVVPSIGEDVPQFENIQKVNTLIKENKYTA